jgi:hypothetical protein
MKIRDRIRPRREVNREFPAHQGRRQVASSQTMRDEISYVARRMV